MTGQPLSQYDVEVMMAEAVAALERETDAYAVIEEQAANAEADYKGAHATAIIHSAAQTNTEGKRPTTAVVEARADTASLNELRVWKIKEGQRRASKETLLSIRARIDALRTLSSNIRSQT